MADIKNELNQIKNAVKGVEVRGSIHDGIDKINKESEESKSKANEAHDVMESIMSEGFDEAALNANFEQKLDNKIANLQPEWTQFKENTETQLAEKVSIVRENITVHVPSDFNTITEAIDICSAIKPIANRRVNIVIESGHNINENIKLYSGDFSMFTITSEDEVVEVADNYSGNLITISNANSPVWDILVDMRDLGDNGYHLESEAKGRVNGGKGVMNAGGTCLYVQTSHFRGAYSIFTGGNNRCAWITRGATASVASADFSHCKGGGVAFYVSRASIVDGSNMKVNDNAADISAVQILRSKLTMLNGEIKNSLSRGLYAGQGAEVSARELVATGCQRDAVTAINSTIDLDGGADVSNCAGIGVFASKNGIVNAESVKANNCETGVKAERNSIIYCERAEIIDAGNYGIDVSGGATVIASSSVVNNAQAIGVSVNTNSTLNLMSGIVNNAGNYGISVQNLSRVNVRNTEVKNSGLQDLHIHHGAFVQCQGTKTTNGSPSINDISVDNFNILEYRGVAFNSE